MSDKNVDNVGKKAIEIKKLLDAYMVGQDSYKQLLAMMVSKHLVAGKTASALIIGPTGSGKTMPFEILKKSKIIPKDYTIVSVNVSRLTEEGVVGPSLTDIMSDFAKLCEMKGSSYKGIIHIDEIDKVVYPDYVTNAGTDKNKNNAVQHQIMQLLDGGTIEGVPVDDILFVFTGAFSRLFEEENKKEQVRQIGFMAQNDRKDPASENNTIRDQLIDIGFQREFLGRINHVVRLNELTKYELKAILLHPQIGEIAKITKEYRDDGIEVEVKENAIDEIIKRIIEEKLGARSVKNIMTSIMEGVWFKCMEKGYDLVIIDKNTIMTGKVNYISTKEKGLIKTKTGYEEVY